MSDEANSHIEYIYSIIIIIIEFLVYFLKLK